MHRYHKINTVYKRDPSTKFKTLLFGDYSEPEFEYLSKNTWEFTEKVDGTNMRANWDGTTVRFGGRDEDSSIPTFLLDRLMAVFTNEKFVEVFGAPEPGTTTDITVFSEGYGAKVQKVGKHYLPDSHDLIVFDVQIGHLFLERTNTEDVARKFGLAAVPVLGVGMLDKGIKMVQAGFPSQLGDITAEGLVMRPLVEMRNRMGNRIIAKIKHRDFACNAGATANNYTI